MPAGTGINRLAETSVGEDIPRQNIDGDQNQQAAGDINNTTINIAAPGNTRALSSSLAKLIPRIATLVSSAQNQLISEPPGIFEKIEFNRVVGHRIWIENYGQYGRAIEALYDEVEMSSPGMKSKILGDIKAKYIQVKTSLVQAARLSDRDKILELLRKNSDALIAAVYDLLRRQIRASRTADLTAEDIDQGTIAVVCHAFIQCRILENPPHAG